MPRTSRHATPSPRTRVVRDICVFALALSVYANVVYHVLGYETVALTLSIAAVALSVGATVYAIGAALLERRLRSRARERRGASMIDDSWRLPEWYQLSTLLYGVSLTWGLLIIGLATSGSISAWSTAASGIAGVAVNGYAVAAAVVALRDRLREHRLHARRSASEVCP